MRISRVGSIGVHAEVRYRYALKDKHSHTMRVPMTAILDLIAKAWCTNSKYVKNVNDGDG